MEFCQSEKVGTLTLNWIFYKPNWKECPFRFRPNINEP